MITRRRAPRHSQVRATCVLERPDAETVPIAADFADKHVAIRYESEHPVVVI